MRPNPKLDIKRAILELGVGEALVSLLDAKGTPGVTERAFVLPPASRIGPIEPDERRTLIAESPFDWKYKDVVDRESAFEKLRARAEAAMPAPASQAKEASASPGATAPAPAGGGILGSLGDILFGSTGPRGGRREGMVEAAAKSAARSAGSAVARQVLRGVLGSLLGGKVSVSASPSKRSTGRK